LTVRAGTQIFTLDRQHGVFVLTQAGVTIPAGRPEYAINASNRRHWSDPIRAFVDECGGIFLYPGDARPTYGQRRLRLVYEANPLALLFTQAGGAATDGASAIFDLQPTDLHQRLPLVLGSRDKVARVAAHVRGDAPVSQDSAEAGMFHA
jgi:fructose-1,6-bisphosphatase I